MSVLETIEEQSSFGFTGRINVLKATDGQFLGVIFLKDGDVVSSQFARKTGLTALISLLIADLESLVDYRLVVEPEIVNESDVEFGLKVSDIKARSSKLYQEHLEAKKLRPPNELRLMINPSYINDGEKPDSTEFAILKTLVEYSKVEDVYKHTDLFEFEITKGLVGLRKKSAIKVVK